MWTRFIFFGGGGLALLFLSAFSSSLPPHPEVEPLIDSPLKTTGSDFNGDGRHDFIIGNDLTDTGGNAYVFLGAATLSGTKNFSTGDSSDFTVVGKAANDGVGRSVASAGDVNGDGIDDMWIGANLNDDGAADGGAAYLFFGLTTLGGTTQDLSAGASPDFTVLGKAGDNLGRAVSGGGDVNGDGFDDLIAGAYFNDDSAGDAGAAYVFYGSSTLSGTKNLASGQNADFTILGKASTDRLGRAVSGGGDLNRDGFDDLWISAPNNDDGTSGGFQEGAAYVFFGASALSNTIRLNSGGSADMTVLGKAGSDYLGRSLSGGGDVNRDGFDDLIVGAERYNGVGDNRGAVYVFFGSTSLSGTHDLFAGGTPDVTVIGRSNYDYLGNSVSGAGDIDDDGFDDIVMGAYRNDSGGSNSGAIYVLYGSSSLSGTTKNLAGDSPAELTIMGKASGDDLGKGISNIGDVNVDGIADILGGAWRNDDGGSDSGAAYLFFGSTSRLTGTKRAAADSSDMTVVGKAALDELGGSVGGGRSNPGP